MLHQYEEHDDDRFRLFLNRRLGGGVELLTAFDVFVINVPGVWGVIAVSMTLAGFGAIGYGLIAVYLMLVNALAHIGAAVVMRCYNPGLATAILIFAPLSVWSLFAIQRTGGGAGLMHVLGLFTALAIHALIVARVLAKRSRA